MVYTSIIVIVLILLIITFARGYFKNLQTKKRLLEEDKAKRTAYFNALLPQIKEAIDTFKNYSELKIGYFSKYKLKQWKTKYGNLKESISHHDYTDINLSEDILLSLNSFLEIFSKCESLRNSYNKRFVKSELELYNVFFGNIENRSLDIQQRTCIVTDDDNNLVIAGAGSGKTTTIVGKVNYLLDRYKVEPEKILLISFTNKSVEALKNRINVPTITARTFHKLGLEIISQAEKKKPSIFSDEQYKPLIHKIFGELIKDSIYLEKINLFLIDFLKPIKYEEDFENKGEYIQYLKDKNFRTYQQQTEQHEIVKSMEECKIANFLFFNRVNYKYEKSYEHDLANMQYRQYKPDFTISQNESVIYLEHFAVSRDNQVPHFFANENESYEEARKRYLDKMKWARQIHESYDTTLIESYSYEMREGILFENLQNNLAQNGILLNPMSEEEKWNVIRRTASEEIKSLLDLIMT
ncbi:MAG: hypothetical protein EOO89_02135, partial [Pedobacter sp.]